MGDFLRAAFRLSTMAAESLALTRPLHPAQKLGDRGTSQRRDTPSTAGRGEPVPIHLPAREQLDLFAEAGQGAPAPAPASPEPSVTDVPPETSIMATKQK